MPPKPASRRFLFQSATKGDCAKDYGIPLSRINGLVLNTDRRFGPVPGECSLPV